MYHVVHILNTSMTMLIFTAIEKEHLFVAKCAILYSLLETV